ncbi:hypothetical protein FB446DRAFT_793251 [Lentinula raphanica]|nr:hypothetical protein EV360DRAFT_81192 [Lentinula raphanica]KAJ3767368.1 hypothetical protein FB446DRAFT_793251 [Lentinula raphanica]
MQNFRFLQQTASRRKLFVKDDAIVKAKRQRQCIDNPINVLAQDAARLLLSASAPADKDKFFLRGTQLAAEYEICLENITNTSEVFQNKKEAIPDLKQAFRETTVEYQEAPKP